MAATTMALTIKAESGTPYQLDSNQVLLASTALLKFIKNSEQKNSEGSAKRSLFQSGEGEEDENINETPIWLVLTTKKHIADKKRLKPSKIPLPNPLNTSPTSKICLITADPQRTYKDVVASDAFPALLRARISRVIGVEKIKAKYHQYEAQRKLHAEHDIFLADDRIITRLPKLLGKTFYKSTTKRPVPIIIQAPASRSDGKRIPRSKAEGSARETISPQKLATEIEKAFGTALVALSPSVTTSVRVGAAGFTPEQITQNVETVVDVLINKFVPGKWRGVRSIHIKGPETAAMPIWLADELWADEKDIKEVAPENGTDKVPETANIGKKRKVVEVAIEDPKRKKSKTGKTAEDDDNLQTEIVQRKEKLKKQKAEAEASVVDEIPKPGKKIAAGKTKKRKASAGGK